jgi:hypothetical protein
MQRDEVFLPQVVHLYDAARIDSLDLDELARFVRSPLPNVTVLVQEDPIQASTVELSGAGRNDKIAGLARAFVLARVRNVTSQQETDFVSHGELEYEKRRILDVSVRSFGILYDGQKLAAIYADVLPHEQLNVKHAHIVITNQLFGTWDDNDKRYHARVSVYGYPSVISTTGVVEAPARPREFYLKRQLGVDPVQLKEEFRGRFIDYDDRRLTSIMKGYVAQALFFHLTGNAFCQNKTCRLYNAHWQEDLIRAQLAGDDFCPEHAAFLAALSS